MQFTPMLAVLSLYHPSPRSSPSVHIGAKRSSPPFPTYPPQCSPSLHFGSPLAAIACLNISRRHSMALHCTSRRPLTPSRFSQSPQFNPQQGISFLAVKALPAQTRQYSPSCQNSAKHGTTRSQPKPLRVDPRRHFRLLLGSGHVQLEHRLDFFSFCPSQVGHSSCIHFRCSRTHISQGNLSSAILGLQIRPGYPK